MYEQKENDVPNSDNVEFLLIELDHHVTDMPQILGPKKEKLFPIARTNLSRQGKFQQFAVNGFNVMTQNLVQGLTFDSKLILALSKQKNQNNHIYKFGFL